MTRIFCALLLVAVSGGCELEQRIYEVRQSKYAADDAFVAQAKALLKVADEGWSKKHEYQRLIMRNTWADWLKNNVLNAQYDDAGNIINGTVNAGDMLKSVDVYNQMRSDLEASERSWAQAKQTVNDAIVAYQAANHATYETEADAHDALMSAKSALLLALEGIGAMGGGVLLGAGI